MGSFFKEIHFKRRNGKMNENNKSTCVDCGKLFLSGETIKEETDPDAPRKKGEAPLYGICFICRNNPNSSSLPTNCTSSRTPMLQEDYF